MEIAGVRVGVDVSKDRLDVAWSDGREEHLENEHEPLTAFARRLKEANVQLVVFEASGGYERDLHCALGLAGVPAALVNPLQVRNFAKATGQNAKTDRIDARVLRDFALAVKHRVVEAPSPEEEELLSLARRRAQLVEMRVAEQNRLRQARSAKVQRNLNAHITWLKKQVKEVDRDIDRHLRKAKQWQEELPLLESIPGVGRVTVVTLLSQLGELGEVNRKKIAALVGIAPFPHESGTMKGQRTCSGGRPEVRAVLYMAALSGIRHNPILKSVYRRLREKGKKSKVAIVACMRRLLTWLNAMLATKTAWDPTKIRPLHSGVPA